MLARQNQLALVAMRRVMVVGRPDTRGSHEALLAPGPMKLTPSLSPSNRARGVARLMLVLGTIGTFAELIGYPHAPRLVLFMFSFVVGLAGVAGVARRSQREPPHSHTSIRRAAGSRFVRSPIKP